MMILHGRYHFTSIHSHRCAWISFVNSDERIGRESVRSTCSSSEESFHSLHLRRSYYHSYQESNRFRASLCTQAGFRRVMSSFAPAPSTPSNLKSIKIPRSGRVFVGVEMKWVQGRKVRGVLPPSVAKETGLILYLVSTG